MIKDQTLDEAIVEAMRFVNAAKVLRAKRKGTETTLQFQVTETGEPPKEENWRPIGGTRFDRCTIEHAACKRASLDLTRKLADLRAGR